MTSSNIEARNNGGIMFIFSSNPTADTTITFQNKNTLTNITSQNNGAVIYSDNTRSVLNLDAAIQTSYTYAKFSGGVIYLKEAKSIYIKGNTYNYFFAN